MWATPSPRLSSDHGILKGWCVSCSVCSHGTLGLPAIICRSRRSCASLVMKREQWTWTMDYHLAPFGAHFNNNDITVIIIITTSSSKFVLSQYAVYHWWRTTCPKRLKKVSPENFPELCIAMFYEFLFFIFKVSVLLRIAQLFWSSSWMCW